MSQRGPTPRDLARAETIARIKELALSQLAHTGAGELSLRAIASELNLVSSAIYRYYSSRDELLTALIVDGYTDLAAAIAAAGARSKSPRAAWVAKCLALRQWATRQPHRFWLLYGSAIPGYSAPESTIGPAGAVIVALFDVVVEHGQVETTRNAALRRQTAIFESLFSRPVQPQLAVALALAFSELVGALTLELGGHFVGSFDPADHLFTELIRGQSETLGLPRVV